LIPIVYSRKTVPNNNLGGLAAAQESPATKKQQQSITHTFLPQHTRLACARRVAGEARRQGPEGKGVVAARSVGQWLMGDERCCW